MTLVFVTMFTVIFIALSGLTGRQYNQGVLQSRDETAFQVAEAGLNYARWRLAHEPDNFEAETRSVQDQQAGVIGSYVLEFTAPDPGSTIVLISSTGQLSDTNRNVTLQARYGIPSLARFASITNNDVWYGGQISGYVHSNGGIRMDGTSDSIMSSAKETYVCQPYHGCNYLTKPGIWGTGVIADLWQFPSPPIDYNAITSDLLAIKDAAAAAGLYYGPSSAYGYHVVLNSNNTFSVYKVTSKKSSLWSYAQDTGWQFTSHDINQQTFVETKPVPSNGVIFFEDTVWVDGEVHDRLTIAAGRFPDLPSTNADIIINGNISYNNVKDGSVVFAAVAQRNVLIPYSAAPDQLKLDGAYIAQKGRFGRRYYNSGSSIIKTRITRYGMIASNLVPVTAWVSGGQVVSGYKSGQSAYDPHMLYGPPPYFPTSGQYEFLSWEQIE